MGRNIAIGIALLAAFAGGAVEAFFLFGSAWIAADNVLKGVGMLFVLAAAALVIPGLFTGIFRPIAGWLFPLAYAGCVLLIGIVVIVEEPLKGLVWFAFGIVIFALGFLSSRFMLKH